MTSLILVESDSATSDALIRIITEHGYLVTTAKTTADAMSRMQESMPDVMLAEIHPYDLDCNGLALANRLRESPGTHAPAIVLMTTSLEFRREAWSAGFRVMLKPFDLATLLDCLRAELETK